MNLTGVNMNNARNTPAKHRAFPSWQDILDNSIQKTYDRDFARDLEIEKRRRRPWLLGFGRILISLFFRAPKYARFRHFTWNEIVELTCAQIAENDFIKRNVHNKEDLAPLDPSFVDQCDESFCQQPCTRSTSRFRAMKAAELISKDQPILLVGDDDFVSVELVAQGFQDICVIDIDRVVLGKIARALEGTTARVRLLAHDISTPLPEDLQGTFNLVFCDPSYSVEMTHLFLDAADQALARERASYVFLSIHLMSLNERGMDDIRKLLASRAYQLREFLPSANHYPIPAKTRNMLKVLFRVLIKGPIARKRPEPLSFFTSDALILSRAVKNLPNK